MFLSSASDHVRLIGNSMSFAARYGVNVYGCSADTLDSNLVSDNADHGLYLAAGTTACLVRGNEVARNAKIDNFDLSLVVDRSGAAVVAEWTSQEPQVVHPRGVIEKGVGVCRGVRIADSLIGVIDRPGQAIAPGCKRAQAVQPIVVVQIGR